MSRRHAFLFIALGLVGSGCYRTSLNLGPQAEPMPASETQRYFVIGVVPLGTPIDLDSSCPGGTARVEQYQGAFSLAAYYLSGGVVDARTAEIYCAPGGSKHQSSTPRAAETSAAPTRDGPRSRGVELERRRIQAVGLKCAAIPMKVQDVSETVAFVADEVLLSELQQAGFEAIGPDDISAMIGFEKIKDAAGCDSATCITEIGNALGVDHLVAGSFATLEGTMVLTLKLLDVANTRVIARATRMSDGGESAVPMMIAEAVQELVAAAGL